MLILYMRISCSITQIWCYQIYLVMPRSPRFPDDLNNVTGAANGRATPLRDTYKLHINGAENRTNKYRLQSNDTQNTPRIRLKASVGIDATSNEFLNPSIATFALSPLQSPTRRRNAANQTAADPAQPVISPTSHAAHPLIRRLERTGVYRFED